MKTSVKLVEILLKLYEIVSYFFVSRYSTSSVIFRASESNSSRRFSNRVLSSENDMNWSRALKFSYMTLILQYQEYSASKNTALVLSWLLIFEQETNYKQVKKSIFLKSKMDIWIVLFTNSYEFWKSSCQFLDNERQTYISCKMSVFKL